MKSLLHRTATALCLALGLLAGQVHAAPLAFVLEVEFDNGPLAGHTASGSFAVEDAGCPAGLCSGSFTPANGRLLDFRITVDGVLFTASMDSDHPFFPEVGLDANVVTFLTYLAADGLPSLSLSAFRPSGGPMLAYGYYTPADGLTSYVAANGITAAVPEPTTALLIALGLSGVAGALRRRRRPAMPAQT